MADVSLRAFSSEVGTGSLQKTRRNENLDAYLAAFGRRRIRVVPDCGVFMADWVLAMTGVDPIADVRGTYVGPRGFARIVRREGGLALSCARRLAKLGFRETTTPAAGDVAIVLASYGRRKGKMQRRPTGAICVDADWRAVMTADLGLVIVRASALPTMKAFTRG